MSEAQAQAVDIEAIEKRQANIKNAFEHKEQYANWELAVNSGFVLQYMNQDIPALIAALQEVRQENGRLRKIEAAAMDVSMLAEYGVLYGLDPDTGYVVPTDAILQLGSALEGSQLTLGWLQPVLKASARVLMSSWMIDHFEPSCISTDALEELRAAMHAMTEGQDAGA